MGTRNTTLVVLDGQTKVAQYGQWDGYPSGNGIEILDFCQKADWNKFKEQVRALKWLTEDQIKKINKDPKWDEKYPYLSRDCGAEILNAIHYGEISVNDYPKDDKIVKVNIVGLVNKEAFCKDSLFCEWAYLIDLDSMNLECYEGFQKEPTEGRFGTEKNGEYYPVKLVKTYSLLHLPSPDTFINDLEPQEEETE